MHAGKFNNSQLIFPKCGLSFLFGIQGVSEIDLTGKTNFFSSVIYD